MKIRNLSYGLLTAAVLMAGCDKSKLDPVPQTQISDATAFQTPQRVLQQVNGLYAAMKSGQFYGGRYLVYQDVRGEDFLNVTENNVTAFQVYNFTASPTDNPVQNLWGFTGTTNALGIYHVINKCNILLEGLATSPIDAQLKTSYAAEAKFIRAVSYFSLLQFYARPYTENNGASPGVPLRLTPVKSSGNNNIARSTVAEVYTQILKDLNEAENELPANHGSNATGTNANPINATRAHKNTAIAFKTRVYLAMGRYNDVITEGNKLVPVAPPYVAPSNVQNGLAPTLNFTTLNQEFILAMPFDPLDLPGTQNGLGSYYNPGPNGNGDFALNTGANAIINHPQFGANDARRAWVVLNANGRTYLRKWPTLPHTDFVPVIRYAEVMLNLAEALARTTPGAANPRALALLTAVHQRSDPGYTFAVATQAQLIEAIMIERRIEFIGEGHRTTDITRLLQPFPAKGSVGAVPVTAAQYIWPIPNSELITNQLIIQNPGY
ncbi:RagB/SusD family nutrient uptake outer membrane protein [Aridibaculum aurantiacum]|uniref:RagB/SusD family nutrient uptake outer membrane protein n=1 Tax=Aridibaculum aurantiacum TaxID=2810307 RepID=UPI001A965961|nr:RagB/SusD family nutrient uptake outer membrane protein [Aridibaculum aurantiacum]